MRDYAKVSPRFWTGPTGRYLRECGRDAQVVALYLITGPSANMIGLYYLALPTLQHEVGISRQGASKALRRASEGGFSRYDEASETVFIPEMARIQIGERLKPKDNRIVHIVREAESFRNSPFVKDFYDKYRDPFNLPEEGPWKGLRSPFEGPSEALRSQEQDQEHEQEQEKAEERAPGPRAVPCPTCADVIAYMNQVGGTAFPTRGAYLAYLHARHGEHGREACRRVIRVTAASWIYEPRRRGRLGDKDMSPFFRPETIFRPRKFPGYLGQPDPGDPRADQFGRLPDGSQANAQETL